MVNFSDMNESTDRPVTVFVEVMPQVLLDRRAAVRVREDPVRADLVVLDLDEVATVGVRVGNRVIHVKRLDRRLAARKCAGGPDSSDDERDDANKQMPKPQIAHARKPLSSSPHPEASPTAVTSSLPERRL